MRSGGLGGRTLADFNRVVFANIPKFAGACTRQVIGHIPVDILPIKADDMLDINMAVLFPCPNPNARFWREHSI